MGYMGVSLFKFRELYPYDLYSFCIYKIILYTFYWKIRRAKNLLFFFSTLYAFDFNIKAWWINWKIFSPDLGEGSKEIDFYYIFLMESSFMLQNALSHLIFTGILWKVIPILQMKKPKPRIFFKCMELILLYLMKLGICPKMV